jgi:hypothetical protein
MKSGNKIVSLCFTVNVKNTKLSLMMQHLLGDVGVHWQICSLISLSVGLMDQKGILLQNQQIKNVALYLTGFGGNMVIQYVFISYFR